MSRKEWHLITSKARPYAAELIESPHYVILLDEAFNWIEEKILRHVLCNPPMWLLKIGWGEKYEDGTREHSPGLWGWHLINLEGNWVYKRQKLIVTVDVPKEIFESDEFMAWAGNLSEELRNEELDTAYAQMEADLEREPQVVEPLLELAKKVDKRQHDG